MSHQQTDGEFGRWAIGWNHCEPTIEHLNEWPGDQAWAAYYLDRYAILRGNSLRARRSARANRKATVAVL